MAVVEAAVSVATIAYARGCMCVRSCRTTQRPPPSLPDVVVLFDSGVALEGFLGVVASYVSAAISCTQNFLAA